MNKKGFTLIELLVVIGILAILTAVVLVAVNPGRQLGQSRNTARRADVNAILTAVTALNADPDASSTVPTFTLCSAGADEIDTTGGAGGDGNVDLESIVAPLYIADIPEDPLDTTADGPSGYTICEDAQGIRYTVCPLQAEVGVLVTDICVTR